MRRDADAPAIELTVLEKPKPGRQGRDGRCCPVLWQIECRSGARFVMVLEEAGELILIVERRDQMIADRSSVSVAQTIVESLVVAVIKPLLLQCPFQVPVDLGHEQKAGLACARPGGGFGPE